MDSFHLPAKRNPSFCLFFTDREIKNSHAKTRRRKGCDILRPLRLGVTKNFLPSSFQVFACIRYILINRYFLTIL
jgi:hypothetical protein